MASSSRTDLRARITEAAASLLIEHGAAALTTRGVAEAAGVQAPTIYRLFGDKDGLLEAVAEHAMATQAAAKAQLATMAATTGINPVDDLRQGWRSQIEFGLNNPSLFKLLSDPDRVRSSPAARTGRAVLAARVHRLAEAGLLRVSENRAVDLIQAAGIGVIQTQLSSPADQRDPTLPDAMYEGVLGQILLTTSTGARGNPVDAAAVTLRATARQLPTLTDAERHLLMQWLDSIISGEAEQH